MNHNQLITLQQQKIEELYLYVIEFGENLTKIKINRSIIHLGMRLFIIIFLILIAFGNSKAQPYHARVYHYNDSVTNGVFSDMLLHPNGFLYIRATHLDISGGNLQYLIKMDTLGNYHWVKEFIMHTANELNLELDTDSNIIFTIAKSVIPYSLNVFLKLDTAGNILQQKYFSNFSTAPILIFHKSIEKGYLFCGLNSASVFGNQPHSALAGFLNKDFSQKWIKAFYSSIGENIILSHCSPILSDHSIIFSGVIKPFASSNYVNGILLLKTDTLGNLILSKKIAVDDVLWTYIVEANDSNFVLNTVGRDNTDSLIYTAFISLDYNFNVINSKTIKSQIKSNYSFSYYPLIKKNYNGNYIGLYGKTILYTDSLFNPIFKKNLFNNPSYPYHLMKSFCLTQSRNLIMAGWASNKSYSAMIFADEYANFGCEVEDTTVFVDTLFFSTLAYALNDSSLYLTFDSTISVSSKTLGYIEYCGLTNIEDVEAKNDPVIRIYPMPFSNTLSIKNSSEISQVELYSMLGKRVFKQMNNEKSNQINIISTDGLGNGIYILKTLINNNLWKSNIVVKVD